MVLGIGTDIIEIKRISDAIKNIRFLNKYFTPNEILLFEKKGVQSIAANFAVKESISKALGTGFVDFMPIDIEVLRDNTNKPFVNLYNGAKTTANNRKVTDIQISISHCKEYAVAFVILN